MSTQSVAPRPRQFLLFVLTSGVAAMVNLTVRYLLEYTISYRLAVAIAYLIGMVTAFLLARAVVFEPAGRAAGRQFARFAAVNVIAFAQVWLVSVGLAEFVFPAIGWVWHGQDIAHVIGVGSPVVTSYLLHKHFSFRSE